MALMVSTPAFSASTRFSCFSSSSPQTSSSTSLRPAVILPGLGNNTNDYQKLALILKDYGVPTVVAKVSRIDWFRNAAGLIDPDYWRGSLRPRPVLDWMFPSHNKGNIVVGGDLSLIGHSAGGWLARLYMQEYGTSHISLLLTLGTPHLPAPKNSPGVIDQTRGLLDYVEKNCAKAVYTPELRYVCIAGRYIRGARLVASDGGLNSQMAVEINQTDVEIAVTNTASTPTPEAITLRARIVGQGYKQVCGQADVWGDGVVPEVSAHLEGALNISLEGVYHSPVGSDDATRPWYGSASIVEQWVHHLLK